MNKNALRLSAYILVFIFVFGVFSVFAETDSEIIERSRQEQNEAQQRIDETTAVKYEALEILNELTAQIDSLQAEIDELDAVLGNYYVELDLLNEEIAEAENRIEIQDDLLKKRLRAMDENGNIGVLDILFGAKSFVDLIERIDSVKTIAEHDQNIIEDFENAKLECEKKKVEIEAKKAAIEDARSQIDNKQSKIEVVQAEKQAEVDELSNLIAQYEAELAASKAAEAEANERIRQAALETSHITASYNFTGGVLNYPFAGHYICTSPYGGRISPITGAWEGHSGVDIGAPYGTPILASADGVVITAGFNTGGYGNYVVIDHGGGIYTLYAHASSLAVSSGQVVGAGQAIAYVGSTGWSTGPHLHFEVRVNGSCVDPAGYIPVY